RLRRAVASVRQARENLWVGSPLAIPWHDRPAAAWVNEVWLGGWLARQCRRLNFQRPIAWTYNPLVGPLLARLRPALTIYHAVDDLAAAPHLPRLAIERAERDLARQVDLIFTTSPALQARL